MCRAPKSFDMTAKNKGTEWATLELVEDPPTPEAVSQPITGPISEKVPRMITLHGNVSAPFVFVTWNCLPVVLNGCGRSFEVRLQLQICAHHANRHLATLE